MSEKVKRHPVPNVYCCGVPYDTCTGAMLHVNAALKDNKNAPSARRGHPSPQEAFKCKRNYLLKQGYTQVDARGFAAPSNGPVLVLTRPSRYGGKLRAGKAGNRYRPYGRYAGFIL